jgi:site-specific DNA-methyltransferase (adenine-specific)
MSDARLPLGQILEGDCVRHLAGFPPESINVIFADPPYNLQLSGDLWRPNLTKVKAVDDGWDQFDSFEEYDRFSVAWLSACRRVLKPDGTLWVIGTYHNIFRLGKILQDLDFWILNDLLWIKSNPMPNFRGVRFTNAHETLIWSAKSKDANYTFNHHAMKPFNQGKQMRSDWEIPLCTGRERIKVEGRKAHSTQKPEALLYRVILSSTSPGDIVLDPFFGTGTTGAVAKKLHREWIGIERDPLYVQIARERIGKITPEPYDENVFDVHDRRRLAPRVPFALLLELGYLRAGQKLYFREDQRKAARVKPDGRLRWRDQEGSIHQLGKTLAGGSPCNGWEHWYFIDDRGEMQVIDVLRERVRERWKEEGEG